MDEIVASVQRVTDIMSEITRASDEQSAGIEQVNHAITQMDDVTQQNAALVDEAAAAAEALQDQASALAQLVSVFKLDASAAAACPARRAVRRRPRRVWRWPARRAGARHKRCIGAAARLDVKMAGCAPAIFTLSSAESPDPPPAPQPLHL